MNGLVQFGLGLFSFGSDKPRSTSVSVLVRFKVRIGVSWTSSENISLLLFGEELLSDSFPYKELLNGFL
ncbi:hypothetical protein Hdeb2414_s0004g00150411 [Helianthus debilis subsp. tardiflorus]